MNCFNGKQTPDIQKLLDQIEQLKKLKQTMSNTNEIALTNKDLLERYDTLFGLLGNDESTKGCLMHNIHNSTGGRKTGRRSRRSKNKKTRSKKRSHK